jgi:hypothetical protein
MQNPIRALFVPRPRDILRISGSDLSDDVQALVESAASTSKMTLIPDSFWTQEFLELISNVT